MVQEYHFLHPMSTALFPEGEKDESLGVSARVPKRFFPKVFDI
jgi:hypothetical protein